jgi:hypothetical protein
VRLLSVGCVAHLLPLLGVATVCPVSEVAAFGCEAMRVIEVPVFVSEWQQACCGLPFALGDRVEWTLVLGTRDDTDLADMAVPLAVKAKPHGEPWQGNFPTMVQTGTLVAYWLAPSHQEGDTQVCGIFLEEHHLTPDGIPASPGRVRRIRAMWTPREMRVEGHTRVCGEKRGPLELRDVASSQDAPFAGGAGRRPGPNYTLDGWLVDLLVEDE